MELSPRCKLSVLLKRKLWFGMEHDSLKCDNVPSSLVSIISYDLHLISVDFSSNRSCFGRYVLPWIHCILLSHIKYVVSQEPKTQLLESWYKVGQMLLYLVFSPIGHPFGFAPRLWLILVKYDAVAERIHLYVVLVIFFYFLCSPSLLSILGGRSGFFF